MPSILYTVRATCKDVAQRGRFLAWLAPGHLLQVKAGGATAVRVVLPDRENATAPENPAPVEQAAVVETQYVFPSRKAFDTYLHNHAPALRTEMQKHFPPECGITFARQFAEIATELDWS